MKREIREKVRGFRTKDGAGVSLVRVLSNNTIEAFDPILMLDSFDSRDPEDYRKGFPMHPHRGIETISLIVEGKMVHKDSLGNEDGITDGEVQWMTAGSGILHEELLPESDRMLGVQLWLNLPKEDKMCPPEYHSLKKDQIEEIELEGGLLRLISGNYKGHQGFQGKYQALDFYHIRLEPGASLSLDMEEDKAVLVFLLQGDGLVAGEMVEEKTAVRLGQGRSLDLGAQDQAVDFLFLSSDRLDEPVAWGGPIVMNTDQELRQAFEDLHSGNFLKENLDY